jgi:spermidine/putrescine transport system permease protein
MIKKSFSGLPVFVAAAYLFLYLPIVILVAYSFNYDGFPEAWSGFSLRWYHELFASEEIWLAVGYSTTIALVSSVIAVLLSIGLVCGLKLTSEWIMRLFYINIFIPDVVLAVGLLTLFSYFFVPLGLTTLIVGHTVLGMGYAAPIIYARYKEFDNRLLEASHDLGASSAYTFFHVLIPFLLPAIVVSFLLVIIVSFDDFLVTFFCAGSSIQTLSLYIYAMIRMGISPIVNALSTLMLIVNIVLVLLISWLTYRMEGGHD